MRFQVSFATGADEGSGEPPRGAADGATGQLAPSGGCRAPSGKAAGSTSLAEGFALAATGTGPFVTLNPTDVSEGSARAELGVCVMFYFLGIQRENVAPSRVPGLKRGGERLWPRKVSGRSTGRRASARAEPTRGGRFSWLVWVAPSGRFCSFVGLGVLGGLTPFGFRTSCRSHPCAAK